MPGTLALRLDRFHARHPWSHNDGYARWVVRRAGRRPGRVLDVGCGTGGLVRRFASRGVPALGVDRDAQVVGTARALSAGTPGATFAVRDALDPGGTAVRYDVVASVAVLHHLPMDVALATWRSWLAPGGRLLVVACYREQTLLDRLVSALAVPANVVMALLLTGRSDEARAAMAAPTAAPTATLAEIRRAVRAQLPGARVRRRLFWRCSVVYTAPGG